MTVSAEQKAMGSRGSAGGIVITDTKRLDLDLHILELRFEGARLVDPLAVEGLARSIERDGQIVPLIAAGDPSSGGRVVLVDGYRRVAALRRLGRDRALVECWPCDLAAAVLAVLANSRSRSFAAIEEALLLRELTQGLGLSQLEVARRCGRNDSWVNRRLKLISALPEQALAAVDIAAVATRADEYLEPAACAQEQACACTNPTAGEILPPHSCSARCGARR